MLGGGCRFNVQVGDDEDKDGISALLEKSRGEFELLLLSAAVSTITTEFRKSEFLSFPLWVTSISVNILTVKQPDSGKGNRLDVMETLYLTIST